MLADASCRRPLGSVAPWVDGRLEGFVGSLEFGLEAALILKVSKSVGLDAACVNLNVLEDSNSFWILWAST